MPGGSHLVHRCLHQCHTTILPSVPKDGCDRTVPSLSTTASKLPSIATKTPPNVCLQSSLPAFSSVILAAPAATHHPCCASLLNCFILHFAIPSALLFCLHILPVVNSLDRFFLTTYFHFCSFLHSIICPLLRWARCCACTPPDSVRSSLKLITIFRISPRSTVLWAAHLFFSFPSPLYSSLLPSQRNFQRISALLPPLHFRVPFLLLFLPLIFLPFLFLCVHFSSWMLFLLFHPY